MDINIDSQIVVQTAAQWAVDATVYSDKRILVTSDAFYGSTDQRKFKIADGTQTWSNLDYMPIDQTLAQVLANDNKTNQIEIKSNNGYSQLNLLNAFSSFGWFGAKEGSVLANDDSLIVYHEDLVELNAPSITKNGDEILTSANITQVITNGVTDKAPSEDAVFDALALKLNSNDASVNNTRITRAIFKQNLTLSHTGDTSNTLKYSSLIAGGTFNANDILKWSALIGATSNANAKTFRFYFNTSASLSGATLVATYAVSSGAVLLTTSRLMVFKNSVSSQEIHAVAGAVQSEYSASGSTPSALTINFAVDQYFIVAIQLGNSGDTANIYGLTSEINR